VKTTTRSTAMGFKDSRLKILSGSAHPALAHEIASYLDVAPTSAYIGRFPDGEIDIKLHEDMRGSDVFVIQPTCPPVNENIVELTLIVDTLRRASAGRITAVMPYFGYARKDRKDEGRVPISAKVIANMLVGAGVDRVVTVDLHAQQIQGFFDIPVDHLWARPVLQQEVIALGLDKLVVCSPDVGGVKLARAWAKALSVPLTIVDKRRHDLDRRDHHRGGADPQGPGRRAGPDRRQPRRPVRPGGRPPPKFPCRSGAGFQYNTPPRRPARQAQDRLGGATAGSRREPHPPRGVGQRPLRRARGLTPPSVRTS
jgi:phosphoribosylpyrophosphate synthetase